MNFMPMFERTGAGLTLTMTRQSEERTKVKVRFDNVYYPRTVEELYKRVWDAVNKRYQKADWGKRPLTRDMLDYARLDTHHRRDERREEGRFEVGAFEHAKQIGVGRVAICRFSGVRQARRERP